MSQPWYTSGPDTRELDEFLQRIAQAQKPTEDDQRAARQQALMVAGLSMFGAPKGQVLNRAGQAGINALMARQQYLSDIPKRQQAAMQSATQAMTLTEQLRKLKDAQMARQIAMQHGQGALPGAQPPEAGPSPQMTQAFAAPPLPPGVAGVMNNPGGPMPELPSMGQLSQAPPAPPPMPQASPSRRAVSDYYSTLAQKYQQAGLIAEAQHAQELAQKNMPELKEQKVYTQKGKRIVVNFYKDGTHEILPYEPDKEKLHFSDTGGSAGVGQDPFSGEQIFAGLPKTPSFSDITSQGQLGVSQGQLALARQREAREAAAQAAEGGPGAKARFANENTLRDEFNRQAVPFVTVRDAYRRVKSAAEAGAGGAGDVALLYGYMKILDPGSTVREGEFATAQQTGGIPGWVTAKYNQAINGERLSTDMRKNIVKQSDHLYGRAEEAHKNTEKQYRTLAERNKLSPENVIVDYKIDLPKTPAAGDVPPDIRQIIERNKRR